MNRPLPRAALLVTSSAGWPITLEPRMKTFSNAEVERRSRLLGKLFRGLTYTGKGRPEDVAEVYLEALADISNEALDRAVDDFIKGRVERRDIAFTPSTAELVVQAQRWEDVLNPPKKVAALEAPPEDEISPEERARMIPRIKALVEEIGRKADAAFEDELSARRRTIQNANEHFADDLVKPRGAAVRMSPALARQLGVIDDPVAAE